MPFNKFLSFAILALIKCSICGAEITAQGSIDASASSLSVCKNTFSGRWYLADSQGRVCPRQSFDSSTGCCPPSAQQYSCDSCGTDDQCCSSYEHCVSCCMTPGSGAQGQMQQVPKGLGKPETGHWEDIFSYCAAACRTTSRSTAHENAFIHERRFCFSEGGRPRVERSTAPPLPPSVLVVPGAFGKSCDVVCQEKHRSCSEAHFASLNDCDSLRRAFKCEAGCGPRSQQAGPFPAYVTDSAAKEEWPAYCFSGTLGGDGGEQGEQAQFSCSAAEEQFGRLCACQEVPQGANDVAEIDGEEGEADVAGQEESGDGAAETWEGDGGAEDLDEDEENEEGEEDESGEDIEPDEKRR